MLHKRCDLHRIWIAATVSFLRASTMAERVPLIDSARRRMLPIASGVALRCKIQGKHQHQCAQLPGRHGRPVHWLRVRNCRAASGQPLFTGCESSRS